MSTEFCVPTYGKPDYDINSLVCQDMSQPEWENPFGVTCYANQSYGPSGGGYVATLIGANLFRSCFAVPTGVTTAKTTVLAAALSGTATLTITLYASNLVTVLATQTFPLTTQPTWCQLNLTGLSSSLFYGLGIQPSASTYVELVQVAPAGGTGVFAADFVRLRPYGGMFGSTSYPTALAGSGGLYPPHGRLADCDIQTDATRMAFECYSNTVETFGPARVGYLVDGVPVAVTDPFTFSSISFQDVALPITPGDPDIRTVTVRAHPLGVIGQGCYIRSICLPLLSRSRVVPQVSSQRFVAIGDSITCGYINASDPHFRSWPARLKTQYQGTVALLANGGEELFNVAPDAATQASFAFGVAQMQPTHVWIALGVNDFLQSHWAAAAFGTAYAGVVDSIHVYAPYACVWCQSPLLLSAPASEAANGAGSTLGNYRTQIQTIGQAGARAPWCHFVDGTGTTFPQTQGSDGIHPTLNGHAQYGQAVAAALRGQGVL